MGRGRLAGAALLVTAAVGLATAPLAFAPPAFAAGSETGIRAADCGPGSQPETGLQGQIPRRDRDSGRSAQGYRCNLTLIGRYQGEGAGVVNPSFGDCAYFGTFFPTTELAREPGVAVVDAADPTRPRRSTTLTSPAALSGTWESMKIDPVHRRLATTAAQVTTGGLVFDLYDIADCAHPKLLNRLAGNLTIPMPITGHEGGFAPDGRTYYATSGLGQVSAVDLSDPARPRVVYTGTVGAGNHGFSISPDGRTMYGVTIAPAGVQILDVGDIQDRRPLPQIRQIGQVSWTDGLATQHTLNFTKDGHHYLYAVDEGNVGAVKLIDIDDPAHPRVLRTYRLEIQQPSAVEARAQDRDGNGPFGYDAHYCTLDRPIDPTRLACSYWESGLRLYDVRDPMDPRELAYYLPPAQTGLANRLRLRNSEHSYIAAAPPAIDVGDLLTKPGLPKLTVSATTDYCASPPEFKSADEIWVTCSDNGFMALRYRPH
jgi:hypothetical protein